MADQVTTYFWVLLCKKVMAAPDAKEGSAKALRSSSAVQAKTIGVVHRDIHTTQSLDVDAAATLYPPPTPVPAWLREGRIDVFLQYSPPFATEAEAKTWIKAHFDPAKHEYAECCFGKVAFSGMNAP